MAPFTPKKDQNSSINYCHLSHFDCWSRYLPLEKLTSTTVFYRPFPLKTNFNGSITVRPTLFYGSECWAARKRREQRMQGSERHMLRYMSGVSMMDRIRIQKWVHQDKRLASGCQILRTRWGNTRVWCWRDLTARGKENVVGVIFGLWGKGYAQIDMAAGCEGVMTVWDRKAWGCHSSTRSSSSSNFILVNLVSEQLHHSPLSNVEFFELNINVVIGVEKALSTSPRRHPQGLLFSHVGPSTWQLSVAQWLECLAVMFVITGSCLTKVGGLFKVRRKLQVRLPLLDGK